MQQDVSTEGEIKSPCRQRQRRPHKKSRSGCANCRLRRVKCDEGRPDCRRCQEYMTPCSYISPNLSNTGEQVIDSIRRPSPTRLSSHHALFTIHPSPYWHHEILFRFCNRTVLTMGSPSTIAKYAEVVPRLAIQHEHLLHTIVAITLLHDRSLSRCQTTHSSTTSESYHLSHAAATFKQKLSTKITDIDKDALWATGVYMCATSVFNIPSLNIEEAWPLNPHPDALKWLNLQAGLRVIWSLADLHRPNGVFANIGDSPDENCVFPRTPQPGIVGLPPLLVELCGLTELSNGTNNPYHTAVRHLTWLLPFRCSPTNMLTFLIFAGGMTPSYRYLLHQRDPRALLLMAIWYSRLFDATWWMATRASVEGQAIHRYLNRLQIHEPTFRKVLELLGRACELHRVALTATATAIATATATSDIWASDPYNVSFMLPCLEPVRFC